MGHKKLVTIDDDEYSLPADDDSPLPTMQNSKKKKKKGKAGKSGKDVEDMHRILMELGDGSTGGEIAEQPREEEEVEADVDVDEEIGMMKQSKKKKKGKSGRSAKDEEDIDKILADLGEASPADPPAAPSAPVEEKGSNFDVGQKGVEDEIGSLKQKATNSPPTHPPPPKTSHSEERILEDDDGHLGLGIGTLHTHMTAQLKMDRGPCLDDRDHKGKYMLIRDQEQPYLSMFDKPLPCCGCGIGWFSFLLGFAVPLMWYFATILYCFNYYRKDPRERAGLAACAIAALICSIAAVISTAILLLL